jgi:hypothetical protein
MEVGQGSEDEPPLPKAGMGEGELRMIRDQVAVEQEVDVQRTGLTSPASASAGPLLEPMSQSEDSVGW